MSRNCVSLFANTWILNSLGNSRSLRRTTHNGAGDIHPPLSSKHMELTLYYKLAAAQKAAPSEFQPTSYWEPYARAIESELRTLDPSRIRAGGSPILGTFGFQDFVYTQYGRSAWKQLALRSLQNRILKNRKILPYGLGLDDIRRGAWQFCELTGQNSNARPLSGIEVTDYGAPEDLFIINDKKYTYAFLQYYLRYCFVQRHVGLTDKEVVVEIGSGSGYQVEVLKKLHPGLTVLCFDLPGPLVLCEHYLGKALGPESIVSSGETLDWESLAQLQSGKVHFFGAWQIPLVTGAAIDLFWNAASFGEMELGIVKNYLSYITGSANFVYLNQAAEGKETEGINHVSQKILWQDYCDFLSDYKLLERRVAVAPVGYACGGDYFEALWTRNGDT